MQNVTISCFSAFHCLTGNCPDTCCKGWEVDLDEDTLQCYAHLDGPLGAEIRENIAQEDGYTFLKLTNGRCPFLQEDGLCRMILQGGEHLLSETCREHPRFWEEYGDLRETCLTISCPEAARLLLTEPFRLQVTETEAPGTEEELDEELLQFLQKTREELFLLLQTSQPLEETFRRLEALGAARAGQSPMPDRPWGGKPFLQAMTQMEFTRDTLPQLLAQALEDPDLAEKRRAAYQRWETEGRRLLAYFLYRYVLRAVWDGCLEEKVRFSCAAVEAIFSLAVELPQTDALRTGAVIFGREVEHCDENLALLYDAVYMEF